MSCSPGAPLSPRRPAGCSLARGKRVSDTRGVVYTFDHGSHRETSGTDPPRSPEHPRNPKLGDIGDVVLATPTFRAFRETYPDACVSVLVRKGYGSLLTGDPHVSEVLEVVKSRSKLTEAADNFRLARRLRTSRYDLVFDLRTGDRGGMLAFLAPAPEKVAFAGDGAFWRRWSSRA